MTATIVFVEQVVLHNATPIVESVSVMVVEYRRLLRDGEVEFVEHNEEHVALSCRPSMCLPPAHDLVVDYESCLRFLL